MQLLRRFKEAIVFRVACNELEVRSAMVSDNLSFLAEVLLNEP